MGFKSGLRPLKGAKVLTKLALAKVAGGCRASVCGLNVLVSMWNLDPIHTMSIKLYEIMVLSKPRVFI